jgi:hypothetical protein
MGQIEQRKRDEPVAVSKEKRKGVSLPQEDITLRIDDRHKGEDSRNQKYRVKWPSWG